MTANRSIEDVLVEVGLTDTNARILAGQAKVIKRNRQGANVLYVPARPFLGEDLFVKKYDNIVLFQREMTAIKLLASSHNTSSLPPRIVYAEEQKRVIVTTMIKGEPLADLIRNASRVDKVLFAQYPIQNIVSLVEHLIRLLTDVCIEPSDFVSGCDHTAKSICKRIVSKYGQLGLSVKMAGLNDMMNKFIKQVENSREMAETEKCCLSYVHGDLALGNIFVDENNVHLIDFEDAGYGPAGRDLAYLIYLIRSLTNNYCYVGDRVRALIVAFEELFNRLFSIPELLLKLWELEWCLNEIWLLKNRNTNIFSSFIIKKRIASRILRIQEIIV